MFAEYAKYYDLFNSDKPYKNEIEFVYRWAEKPKSILDIGCGTAIYWKFFPKSCDLIGMEKSKKMIELAPEIFKKWIYNGDISRPTKDWPENDPKFDCATALFNVINYFPRHEWWKTIPIKKGGFLIFDIWDKEKVDKDGFTKTRKVIDGFARTIKPINHEGKSVKLEIFIEDLNNGLGYSEEHRLYIYSHADIERFCGKEFEIVEVKPTRRWQTWYKLRRK